MKRLLVLAAAAAVAVGGALSASAETPAPGSLAQRFAYLSSQHSNQCSLRPQAISSLARNGRLQGSCCTPMVYRHYVQQIQGLRSYAGVPEVPSDPYDVSVWLANQLVTYDRTIRLADTAAGLQPGDEDGARTRALLLPLLALDRFRGTGEGVDRLAAFRCRADRRDLGPRGRLRRPVNRETSGVMSP